MGETFIPSEILHHILSYNLIPYTSRVCIEMQHQEELIEKLRLEYMELRYPGWDKVPYLYGPAIDKMISELNLEAIKFMCSKYNTYSRSLYLKNSICSKDDPIFVEILLSLFNMEELLLSTINYRSLKILQHLLKLVISDLVMNRVIHNCAVAGNLGLIDWIEEQGIQFDKKVIAIVLKQKRSSS